MEQFVLVSTCVQQQQEIEEIPTCQMDSLKKEYNKKPKHTL